jgi:hypothetical protein
MAELSSRGYDLRQGEEFTLRASAAAAGAVVDATGTAIAFLGERRRFIILLDVTALATDAGDHLDVYIDCLISGTTWVNAGHFTQQDGTGAAFKEYMVLDAQYPGTASIDVTSDAAETTVRPSVFGSQMRARWTVTDAGGANASFTFAVTGYAL